MIHIYINAKTEELCASIASALDEFDCDIAYGFTDEEAASRDLTECDAVIVSTPLRSEFGLNYVSDAAKRTDACIIVLARTDIADDVHRRIKYTGAFVVGRPFTKSTLVQTLRVALQAKDSIRRLEQEKTVLSKQIDDIKLIDRAKCCLIEYLNLTEKQAHRHIQKLAMDTRRTQREIAEDILRTYSGMTNV